MKLLLVLPVALLVTLLLFYLMHFMISGQRSRLVVSEQGAVIEFVRLERSQDAALKSRRRPERPPPEQAPPPRPVPEMAGPQPPALAQLNMAMPKIEGLDLKGAPFLGGVGGFTPEAVTTGDFSRDEDVVALTRIAPQYPRKAALRGIEGWVKVEFTVLEDGSVADVKVLEAEPGRIFNSAATRAILRWRFKPKVVDGKPVQRRATQTIDFKLEQ